MKAGILTSAGRDYFPGLRLLVDSLKPSRRGLPFRCVDLGLDEAQREWCERNGVSLATPPLQRGDGDAASRAGLSPREAALWHKPLFVAGCGFDRLVWLDSDVVVLGDVGELLDLASDGPVFTPDGFAGVAACNPDSLYELLPIPVAAGQRQLHLNAGVFVMDLSREAALLADWVGLVRRALNDSRLRSHVNCHDQGALLWAVLKHGLGCRVMRDARWNWPANNRTCDPVSAHGRQRYPNDRHLLRRIRDDHPRALAVHWMGAPKLWEHW